MCFKEPIDNWDIQHYILTQILDINKFRQCRRILEKNFFRNDLLLFSIFINKKIFNILGILQDQLIADFSKTKGDSDFLITPVKVS